MDINLRDYHYSVNSQFGQDGVLKKIFEVIKPINKYFVEFGSSANDVGGGNTSYLRSLGFEGLLMNGSDKPYGQDIIDKKYDLKVEFITAENIEALLNKYLITKKFDLLSIDIDGNDYWIWKAITWFYPQVVCIESNACIPLYRSVVQPYNPLWVWQGNCQYGASRLALYKLARIQGYSLVAFCGCDMIFVRDSYIPNDIHFTNINDIEKICVLEGYFKDIEEVAMKEINSYNTWIEV